MIKIISSKLRVWFLYGLILVLPVAITIWLVITLINVFSMPFNLIFQEKLPNILGFLITISIITLLGLFGRNFIGKTLLKPIELLMNKTPLINIIYKSVKQIISSFALQDKENLNPVLIEYPRKGLWAIGFLTQSNVLGLNNKEGHNLGKDKVAVLIPTTPNPTSGFFVYVHKDDIELLNMSVEDSIRVLMSAGVVSPNMQAKINEEKK
eukprot:COSAG01_NODE_7491_length_3186_cov_3.612569_4_plen_209_part_00